MEEAKPPVWTVTSTRVPDTINSQLVGTFPSIVAGGDGELACAFFVRVTLEEFSLAIDSKSATCLIRPQYVMTPQGPILVAYCMVQVQGDETFEPFVSETALFPRLSTMQSHRDITTLLLSGCDVYLVVCDESGKCLFNSKSRILDEWRSELAEKAKGFDEGTQVTDEKSAIMSLYWYQDRYNPSSKIFEVSQ